MAAAAYSPAFAKRIGLPVEVAEDFNQADAGADTPAKERKRTRWKAWLTVWPSV